MIRNLILYFLFAVLFIHGIMVLQELRSVKNELWILEGRIETQETLVHDVLIMKQFPKGP
jgi:hypothetical protein